MSWQNKLEQKIKEYLEGYSSCHDYWHLFRVRNSSMCIAEEVASDEEVLEAGALLHDVGYKGHESDHKNHQFYGMEIAEEWLPQVGFPATKIQDVCEVIRLHDDYHKGENAEKTSHIETKIIQDADKIEALGAIGVARLTYYFGEKGWPIYNDKPVPKVKTIWLDHDLLDQIQRDAMIKYDLLHFDISRRLSQNRYKFLQHFYEELKKELLEHHGGER